MRQHPAVDENSRDAFEAALTHADGLETDAILSGDETVFLGHDSTQRGLGDQMHSVNVLAELLDPPSAARVGTRRLDQLPDAEVAGLRLKKGAEMGRLSDVFNLAAKHPGKIINIELKGDKAVEPVLKEINEAVAAGKVKKEQIILTSFNHPAILQAKKIDPSFKFGVIFTRVAAGDTRIFPWNANQESRYCACNEAALQSKLIRDINPDYFVLNSAAVTAGNVSLIQKYFPAAKVMFWTSNEEMPEDNKQLIGLLSDPLIGPAVEAVITDHPKQMADLLKAKGLRL
jgi:glycerophosphoryl diester phosphodiesterase